MELACNVVALGNNRVISTVAVKDLNGNLRTMGFEVFDPEMSMFTDAGGGMHCMVQPLWRAKV